jgi:hypothetical protein
MSYNEADAVRLVRPKGNKCRLYKIKLFLMEEKAVIMNNSAWEETG